LCTAARPTAACTPSPNTLSTRKIPQVSRKPLRSKLISLPNTTLPLSPRLSSSQPQLPNRATNTDNNNNDTTTNTNPNREPEFALILAACGVGIATGAGVVLLNYAIHEIRDIIWHADALPSGRQLLKEFTDIELFPRVLIPPILGGLVVGLLSISIGGFAATTITPLDSNDKNILNITSNGNGTNGHSSATSSSSISGDQIQRALRPLARAVAAAITLGTGASLGPEGPSVDIGRSIARGLGVALKSEKRLVALVAAGSGAGVAAGFNAPIAGVFFAVETVLQRQLIKAAVNTADTQQSPLVLKNNSKEASNSSSSSSISSRGGTPSSSSLITTTPAAVDDSDSDGLTIAMVLLACVLAAVTSQAGLGASPAFRVPAYRLESLAELPLYLVFGALCGAVSASFSFSARVASNAFEELKGNNNGESSPSLQALVLPAIGGLTTGVLALGYPEILYLGFDNVNSILSAAQGEYGPGLLIQIVVLKIIATSISRGSGLQGGIYAPSIFMGAALGSAFGELAHVVGDPYGLTLSEPAAYALVGVGAMLASNCAVPLTSVLLLFELTRDYLIILPTLAAVGISYWVSTLAAPNVRSSVARLTASNRMTSSTLYNAAGQPGLVSFVNTSSSTIANDDSIGSSGSIGSMGSNEDMLIEEGTLPDGLLMKGIRKRLAEKNNNADALTSEDILAAATEASQEAALTVACALESSCVVVYEDTLAIQALEAMDQGGGQAVAVVMKKDGGGVAGLVSRELLEKVIMETRMKRE
jgi:H+/Cl- antiporter ClcA